MKIVTFNYILLFAPIFDLLRSNGTDGPGKQLSYYHCRYLKNMQVWHLVTWFNGGLISVGLMAGLKDLKGLFKPKEFYDSVFERVVTEVQKP